MRQKHTSMQTSSQIPNCIQTQTHRESKLPLGFQSRWSAQGLQAEAGTNGSCHKSFGSCLFCSHVKYQEKKILIQNSKKKKKITATKDLDNKIKIRQFKYLSKGMGSQSQHPIISILSWHFSFANLFQSILHSKIKQTIMGFKKKMLKFSKNKQRWDFKKKMLKFSKSFTYYTNFTYLS